MQPNIHLTVDRKINISCQILQQISVRKLCYEVAKSSVTKSNSRLSTGIYRYITSSQRDCLIDTETERKTDKQTDTESITVHLPADEFDVSYGAHLAGCALRCRVFYPSAQVSPVYEWCVGRKLVKTKAYRVQAKFDFCATYQLVCSDLTTCQIAKWVCV